MLGAKTPTIFSFGCGIALDYLCAVEVFGNDVKYYGIDECDWTIKETAAYKNFEPKLPKTIKFDSGRFLLNLDYENLVICFFNSLFTISNNTDLEEVLIEALENKHDFYIICNCTINNNYHMPKEEQDFIDNLTKALSKDFRFKSFEILDGKGIIVYGSKIS